MISVIVPVYNVEDYLKIALDSLVMQTFYDFEVILINDGSTDMSGNICEEYARLHSNFHVYHKKNGGQSAARNFGIFLPFKDLIVKNSLSKYSNLFVSSI